MTHYGMAIDTRRCVGCNACTTACKMANNVPAGVFWTRALTDGGDAPDTPAGTFPSVRMSYLTVGCQHCENPACVKVCPVGATYRDEATGIVRQDYDKCIGCRMCMSACPYTGVRSFNWEEPQYFLDFPTGDPAVPAHEKHTVEKCTMCWHRQAQGLQPQCVVSCPTHARFWGDLNDPDSEVSRLVAARSWEQLLPEMGTEPNVYYLV